VSQEDHSGGGLVAVMPLHKNPTVSELLLGVLSLPQKKNTTLN